MQRWHWTPLMTLLVVFVLGCGQSSEESPDSPATTATETAAQTPEPANPAPANPTARPEQTVALFLDALKSGNREAAALMMTPAARQRVAGNFDSTPGVGKIATFSIGEVFMQADDLAYVLAYLTEVGADGQQKTDPAHWAVRKTPEGWRIAGIAVEIIAGEEPFFLNFEEDMQQQFAQMQQRIEQRMAEARAAAAAQATQAAQPGGQVPVQR